MKNIFRWPVLWWLRFWAQLVLKINHPFIVGVTGSAGKSSAVDAIAPVLRLKFKKLKVAEKANSESGIPADILGLHFTDYSPLDWLRVCVSAPFSFAYCLLLTAHSSFDAYLVEMGIDEPTPPKNMEYLLTILRPDLGVILNVLPVHTQQFERPGLASQGQALIKSIADEKGKLVTQNSNLKYAILNADQPEISELEPENEAQVITFGKAKNSNVIIESIASSLSGTSIVFRFQRPGLATAARPGLIKLPNLALPEFYGYTLASALAVASSLNINLEDAGNAISKDFKLPPGRGRIFEGIKNTTIIDSSYNASGETVLGSLKMLRQIGKNKIKIAILGDMRELGSQAEIEHKKVAEMAIKSADKIILVGPLMKQFALPIISKSELPVEWFATAGQARDSLQGCDPSVPEFLTGGEIILVKGSQNTIFLEIVVEALLKNKSDVKNLCRRGKFWDKKRQPFN